SEWASLELRSKSTGQAANRCKLHRGGKKGFVVSIGHRTKKVKIRCAFAAPISHERIGAAWLGIIDPRRIRMFGSAGHERTGHILAGAEAGRFSRPACLPG